MKFKALPSLIFFIVSSVSYAQFTLNVQTLPKLKPEEIRIIDSYSLVIKLNGRHYELQARTKSKSTYDLIDKTTVFNVYEINNWYGLLVDTTSQVGNGFKCWIFSFDGQWQEYHQYLELINSTITNPSVDYVFFKKSPNRLYQGAAFENGKLLFQSRGPETFEQLTEEYISWHVPKPEHDSILFWNNAKLAIDRVVVISKKQATSYVQTSKIKTSMKFPLEWEHFKLSPDGRYLLLQFASSRIEVFDTGTGKVATSVPDVFYRCEFSFDNYFDSTKINISTPDKMVRTLDLSGAPPSLTQSGHFFRDDDQIETQINKPTACSRVDFLNNGVWFVTLTGGSFTVWDTKTKKIIREYAHSLGVRAIFLNVKLANGSQHFETVVSLEDGSDRLEKLYYEINTGKEIRVSDFLDLRQVTTEIFQIDSFNDSQDSVQIKSIHQGKNSKFRWDPNFGFTISDDVLYSPMPFDTLHLVNLYDRKELHFSFSEKKEIYWKHLGGVFFLGLADDHLYVINYKTSTVIATFRNDDISTYQVNQYHLASNSLLITKTRYLGVDSTVLKKDLSTGEAYYPKPKFHSAVYQYFDNGVSKEIYRIDHQLTDCALSPEQDQLILISDGLLFAEKYNDAFQKTEELEFAEGRINESQLLKSFEQVPAYNYCGGLMIKQKSDYEIEISSDRNIIITIPIVFDPSRSDLCENASGELSVRVSRRINYMAVSLETDNYFGLFKRYQIGSQFGYEQVKFNYADSFSPDQDGSSHYGMGFSFKEGHFFFRNRYFGTIDFHNDSLKPLFLAPHYLVSTDTLDRTAFFSKGDDTYVLIELDRAKPVNGSMEEQKGLLKAYLIDSTRWIVVHASGLFDGPQEILNAVHFVKGMNVIPLEALKTRYYEPNLAQKLFRGEELRNVKGLNSIELPPDLETGPLDKKGFLPVKVKNRGGGIGRVAIFINGREVIEDARPKNSNSNSSELVFKVYLGSQKSLVKGADNFILVKVWNKDEWVVNRGTLIKYNSGTLEIENYQPAIHILACGVSDYTGTELDLKYAAKDAEDVSKSLQLGAKQLFGTERCYVYTLTTERSKDSYPTKLNIFKAFERISSTAHPLDVFVMYVSGHGINHGGQDGDWYYLTQEAYTSAVSAYNDATIRKLATISSNELAEMFKKIPAQKQVLIIDACASGRVVENLMTRKDVSSSTLRALDRMRDRTGMHIITGCTSDAVSYEASKYAQGVLTYSLLEGIRGAALREDKFIDVNRLFQYANERVPTLARGIGGIQTPRIFSPQGAQSFDLGLLTETEKKDIPIAKIRPVYIRSNFQDETEYEDILGLGKLIDEAMNETASKGAEAKFIFVDVKDYPDGCKLVGRYQQKDGKIILNLRKRCGEGTTSYEITADNVGQLKDEILKVL